MARKIKTRTTFLGAELMKLLTYIFAFAYFLTLTPTFAANSSESRIAAVVNHKSILTSDLNHRLKLVLKDSPAGASGAMLSNLRKELLNAMIDEKLQQLLVEKFEIKIDDSDVKSAWDTMEQRMGFERGQLNEFLKAQNIPDHIIKDQIRISMGWQHYLSERYGKDIQITDADVRSEMAKIEKNKEKNQALLSEIVLTYDSPEKEEEAKRKAAEVSAKIRSGAQFPLLAQQYSHSASAARGGDIGWVNLDQLEPEVKKAVNETRRGDISQPIPVKGGYRILGVRDRHGVGSLGESTEYVSFQQIEFLFPMFGGEEGAQETHVRAHTIREQARSCSMMKKLTDGKPRVKTRMIEHMQTEMMHPELAKVIRKLKPGERSDLLNTGEGLIMFMVCDKNLVKPHEPDEKEIRATLREKKMSTYNEKELRALRRAAHIEIKA
jgi:peptidyl-prolyl cis-trans isomerase SurA